MRNFTSIMVLCLALAACVFCSLPALAAQAPAAPAAHASLGPERDEQFVVNMTGVYPSWHPMMQKVLRPWADSLLEQTGGRLAIRIFEPGAIAYSNELSRAARLGQAGLAVGVMNAEVDDFRLALLAAHEPGELSLKELSRAYWRMYTEIPELAADFEGIKLLAVYAGSPYQLCMAKGLPYDAASLTGKRFLVDSPLAGRTLEGFGARVTVIPQTDFKMFMDDKIADGVVLNLDALSRLDAREYISGISLCDLENCVVWVGMHQGVWDMLPQDIRRTLTLSSGLKLSEALGAMAEQNYRAELADLQNSRVKLHYFSSEERAKFYKNMREVKESEWQKLAREMGHNAKNLQDRISKIMTEAKAR